MVNIIISRYLIAVLFLLFPFASHAQHKIRLKSTFPVGKKFAYEDENFRSVGFTGRNLKPIVEQNEKAYLEFKRYRTKLNGMYFVGLPMIIAGGILYGSGLNQNVRVGFSGVFLNNSSNNPGSSQMYGGASMLATAIVSTTILKFAADKHLLNAVKIFNGS